MEALKTYRRAHNLSQAELGERLGVSQVTVSKYERGTLIPNLAFAFEIEKLTDGAVPPASWLPPSPDKVVTVPHGEDAA